MSNPRDLWIYLWNFSGDNDDNEDNKDNEDSEDNKENEDSEENDNSEDNDIEITPWILEICETLITFLAIENNNIIIHSDLWMKSERDSIRNSCDVLWTFPLGRFSVTSRQSLVLSFQSFHLQSWTNVVLSQVEI